MSEVPQGGGRRQQRAAEIKAEMERDAAAKEASVQAGGTDHETAEQTDATSGDSGSDAAMEVKQTCPIGAGEHEVKQGESIGCIAQNAGHIWEKIWDHPDNKELREARMNPDVLLPGDKVVVPEIERKDEPGTTETKNRFRKIQNYRELHLDLVGPGDDSLDGHTYKLTLGSEVYEGDATEPIDLDDIPFSVTTGELIIFDEDGEEVENIELKLDALDPIKSDEPTIQGLQARLNNLGYQAGPVDGICGPMTRHAIRDFQADHGVTPTGNPDDIYDDIKDDHGC